MNKEQIELKAIELEFSIKNLIVKHHGSTINCEGFKISKHSINFMFKGAGIFLPPPLLKELADLDLAVNLSPLISECCLYYDLGTYKPKKKDDS